jgi:hypothetical protein
MVTILLNCALIASGPYLAWPRPRALPAGQQATSESVPAPLPLQRLPRNLHYLTTLRKFTLTGALDLLLTWMFPIAGLMYFVAPKVRHPLPANFPAAASLGLPAKCFARSQ